MTVCARHKNPYRYPSSCISVHSNSLLPGGNITVHFNQLVVADTITINKYNFLILCEVDVLGTRIVLDPEG